MYLKIKNMDTLSNLLFIILIGLLIVSLVFVIDGLIYIHLDIKRKINKNIKSRNKFDFSHIVHSDIAYKYNIDMAFDTINYLLNRYNIPHERVLLHDNGYYGKFAYYDNNIILVGNNGKEFNLNGHIYDSEKEKIYFVGLETKRDNPYIYAPYPDNFDKYVICLHEIFNWVRKHQTMKNKLRKEYEAERMTKTFLHKSLLFHGHKFDINYYDVLIHSNLSKYTDEYNYKIATDYMKQLMTSEDVFSKYFTA